MLVAASIRQLTLATIVTIMSVSCQLTSAAQSSGFRPNGYRFDGETVNSLNSIYDGDTSSYVSYKTPSGLSVYPRAYNITSAKKSDRQGVLLATRPLPPPPEKDRSAEFAAFPPGEKSEDFASYSPDELYQLQSKCYQYHYHYGPLYDVDQAVRHAASGLRNSVQRTATDTARKFYQSTNRLNSALHTSGNRFARFLRAAGGKILLTVVGVGMALLVFSLLQIYVTAAAGRSSLFGRAGAVERLAQWAAGGVGVRARSRAADSSPYDAISILTMLEDAFRKMEVADFVCQQRLVCEAHGAGAAEKYGEVASRLQKIVGSADERATDGADSQVADKFAAFRDAAMRGIQQQDCQLTYAAKCPKGLRHYVTASSKY